MLGALANPHAPDEEDEMHVTPALSLQDAIAPVVVAILFILGASLFKEPKRRDFMAIVIAGAGSAYLSGGFGVWEFVFAAVITVCAYNGLRSYRLIGIGWALHTLWDVLHHLYGNAIVPFLPTSSAGCAVCDLVIALWCFAGAPSAREALTRVRSATASATRPEARTLSG
jgi:hypothetical protein